MKQKMRVLTKLLVILIVEATASAANTSPWVEHPDYLTFGVPNKIAAIDPTASVNLQTKSALALVYEQLVRANADQQLEPMLAESWTLSDDKRNVTFVLRRGHRFSDGSEVTAKDVVDSFKHICSSDSKSRTDFPGLPGCQAGTSNAAVIALDKYRVKFGMTVDPTIFLYELSSLRAVVFKSRTDRLLGSGPYQIATKTDNFVVLDRNPFFFSPDKIKNAGLILRYIDENDFGSSLSSGDLPDGTIWYRVSAIGTFHSDNYRVIDDRPNITQILVFNNQRYPFNQPIVRQAVAAEIYNNEKINECALGTKKAYGVIPIGIGGSIAHTAPERVPEITPEEVFSRVPRLQKQHATVVIHQHVGRRSNCEGTRIIEAARKFHVDIKFKYHDDYSSLWPLYINHNLDGFVELFVFANRDAHSTLKYFLSTGTENWANLTDRHLDKLMSLSWQAGTVPARYSKYRDIDQYMQTLAVVVPLYYVGHSNFLHKCLAGVGDTFYFDPFNHLTELYRTSGCSLHPK